LAAEGMCDVSSPEALMMALAQQWFWHLGWNIADDVGVASPTPTARRQVVTAAVNIPWKR